MDKKFQRIFSRMEDADYEIFRTALDEKIKEVVISRMCASSSHKAHFTAVYGNSIRSVWNSYKSKELKKEKDRNELRSYSSNMDAFFEEIGKNIKKWKNWYVDYNLPQEEIDEFLLLQINMFKQQKLRKHIEMLSFPSLTLEKERMTGIPAALAYKRLFTHSEIEFTHERIAKRYNVTASWVGQKEGIMMKEFMVFLRRQFFEEFSISSEVEQV